MPTMKGIKTMYHYLFKTQDLVSGQYNKTVYPCADMLDFDYYLDKIVTGGDIVPVSIAMWEDKNLVEQVPPSFTLRGTDNILRFYLRRLERSIA